MRTYLALGSNLGDRMGYLQQAVTKLAQEADIRIVKKARIYETAPYGDVPQDDFLNTVVAVETTLSPDNLLQVIHRIEAELDRKRVVRWGPRTIDIDILLMNGLEINTPSLTIPHQELTKRAFVLIPLQDVYDEEMLFGKSLPEWIDAAGNAQDVTLSKESWLV